MSTIALRSTAPKAPMTPAELLARTSQRPLLLDGGLGTVLIAMGLEQGRAPEHWIAEHPDRILKAHQLYVEAGSDVVHAATFGATPLKLAAAGLDGRCDELNKTAVDLARRAAGNAVLVAGDIGPTGRFLPPVGEASDNELEQSFNAQVESLRSAGVDLLSIETMYDLREARAAVRAAVASGLAVLCSMTFELRRKGIFTIMGNRLDDSLATLLRDGATAVGFNCTVTSDSMVSMVDAAATACPGALLVAQPNAGQPRITSAGVHYDASPDAFAADLVKMFEKGARILGGCCGTDHRFLRATRAALDSAAGAHPR